MLHQITEMKQGFQVYFDKREKHFIRSIPIVIAWHNSQRKRTRDDTNDDNE